MLTKPECLSVGKGLLWIVFKAPYEKSNPVVKWSLSVGEESGKLITEDLLYLVQLLLLQKVKKMFINGPRSKRNMARINGVPKVLPLLLSSGSLSVPLVSSVSVNERKTSWRWVVGWKRLVKPQSDTGSQRVFYNLQLHRLQLALALPSTAACCCQLNVTAMLMWVSFGSVCLCACITSHRDALVLHSLPPSLVIKDSLDLVNVLWKREGECKQVLSPSSFNSRGTMKLHLPSMTFLVPLIVLHFLVTELRFRRYRKQVFWDLALIHSSWSRHENVLIQEIRTYLWEDTRTPVSRGDWLLTK